MFSRLNITNISLNSVLNRISESLNLVNKIIPLFNESKPILNTGKKVLNAFNDINKNASSQKNITVSRQKENDLLNRPIFFS